MFLIFMGFSVASLAWGYLSRRRGWLPERLSSHLHLHALLWGWAPIAMISFWRLELSRDLLILLLAQPVLMLIAAGVMERLTAWMRCTRVQRGVLILAAGLSNQGFTLGAYLCYALLHDAERALAYGIAFTMSMVFFNVLIFYPIAHHFGSDEFRSADRLIARSLSDVRALPLYLSLGGIVLSLTGLPVPPQIDAWRLMDILFFAGAGAAYAGIGLRLRLGDSLTAWRLHLALGTVQFIVHPLATVGVLVFISSIGLGPGILARDVMVIEAFVPTAINVVILANLFHLDARLASILWVGNTLAFCLIILPILMLVYR